MGSSVKFYLLPSLHFSSDMKVALYFVAVVAVCNAESWLAGPYTIVKRAAEPQNLSRNLPSTRFFTGNRPLDAGIAGAAAGAATQYFANQIFNPCTRGGTRNNNRGTNNRIFGNPTLQNGLLGFAAGFAGAALIHNAQGNPCGK